MAQFRTARLTLTAINGMKAGEIVHDTELKGFGARRQTACVSYFLRIRLDGRQKLFTIGRHGQPWTPEAARKRAKEIMGAPHAALKPMTLPVVQGFAAVADQFLEQHGPKLKPRTLEEYQRLVRLFLKPAFGKAAVNTITRGHVSTAHAGWKSTPRAANHALAVLSRMMSWAEEQGLRDEDSNPCRRIEKYKETKREEFLSTEQLKAVGDALAKAENEKLVEPYAIAALRLLILTGARLSEILTLKWSYVDTERRMLHLPISKTGKKIIPLNEAAIAVLDVIPRFAKNPYVIVGAKDGEHLVNLQKPWRAIRKLARLDHVRIHDLRHTYASMAVAAGGSLPMIGRMLGHAQPQTTARYAHLTDDPVQKLAQSTGEALLHALSGTVKNTAQS